MNMKKEDLWNLFKMTGKLEYYLAYKEEVKNEPREAGRDCC